MAGDIFDIERIRRLVQLMEEHDLAEVDLRQSEQQIKLCRAGMTAAPMAPVSLPAAAPAAAAVQAEPVADDDNLVTINAPMVGTFYGRPNPESEPFVKVGQAITPETTVCIVEAMKVFNEIPAEVNGTIVEVLASNEDAVDFGRPLFKVDTQG